MTVRRERAGLEFALAALMLLGACASKPPLQGNLPWTSGKLALTVAAAAGRPLQRLVAGFDLQGDDQRGELRLSLLPLGTSLATARWSGNLAVLQTSDGERQFASLDELARQALGEPLPLRALPDWLAGRPWAGAAVERREALGFEQLGWRVDLTHFGTGSILASRDSPPAVTLQLRLERPD